MSYTYLPADPTEGIHYSVTQCDNCGAYIINGTEKDIKHHASCDPCELSAIELDLPVDRREEEPS